MKPLQRPPGGPPVHPGGRVPLLGLPAEAAVQDAGGEQRLRAHRLRAGHARGFPTQFKIEQFEIYTLLFFSGRLQEQASGHSVRPRPPGGGARLVDHEGRH